jgi:cytochrome P450
LYQSFDATAALIATMLDAEAGARTRTAAIPRTVRQALVDVTFGELEFAQGDDVQLEIGTPTLEFGSGPHRCPGRDVAELIATSVVDTLAVTGYVVDLSTVVHDEDGRPMSLSVRRPGRSTDVQ